MKTYGKLHMAIVKLYSLRFNISHILNPKFMRVSRGHYASRKHYGRKRILEMRKVKGGE